MTKCVGCNCGDKLKDESKLLKVVSGNLRSTINAHGDIKPENIGSAAKRIVKQLMSVL